ncbi:MAG: hypothetical protein QOI24_627 [Acidobacteriota bacterium]|jgi:hypothetical protein|nr:hypothetical protein [Acidobacteriota bacterium]
MKYVSLLLVIILAVFPASAFAGCPTQTGPYYAGVWSWFDFDFDTSCASTTGNVSTATLSCFSYPPGYYSYPGYQWNYFSGSVDYQMTVPINVYSNFSVSVWVDFSDPHSYSGDAIAATVVAMHNTTVTHMETIFIHQGNQGSLSCTRFDSSTFTASPGDTIEVIMTGQTYYSDATMQISTPTVFSTYP